MGIPIATAAATAARRAKPLPRLSEIEKLFARIGIVHDGAYGNLKDCVDSRAPMTFGAFPVAATFGAELAIVAIAKQGVVVGICFEVNVTTIAAIPARRSAARHILLPAEGHAAVSAVSAFY
jgi:hypothetical protein